MTKYIGIKQLAALGKYSIPKSSMYRLFARRHENGLADICFNVGGKLLVEEAEFESWLRSKRDVSSFDKAVEYLKEASVFQELPPKYTQK